MELVHGGDWAGYRAEFGRDALDFSANVSPLGLPAGVAAAITAALPMADRYPDPLCRALRTKLAAAEGVDTAQILCGNGAADLIYRLALALRPRRALLPAPTFAEYAAALETVDCDVQRFLLREENDFSVTDGFVDAIDDSTDAVFLCQPNNPTGQVTPLVMVQKLLRRCADCGAVLVVDECGKFVISLLSGHLGGANELALKTAEILEAIPVVTTATDLHHRFAVDVFAKKNNCNIFNMKAAKEVSAALLAGKKVGFYSEFPTDGELPEGLSRCDEYGNPVNSTDDRSEEETQKSSDFNGTGTDCTNIDCGVAVTVHTSCNPFISTTQVVPKCLTLGMGCRKDKDARGIAEAAQKVLDRSGFHKEAFEQIASIDLKKEEKGILSLSQDWQIPFVTYTEEELKQVPGEFTPSPFVKKITGVDNVCERSAVLASGNGRLLQRKTGENGVTTAVAAREWRIHFE